MTGFNYFFMLILKENDLNENSPADKITVDALLNYDYMLYKALSRILGFRPLQKPEWHRTLVQRRKRTYRFIKALANSM